MRPNASIALRLAAVIVALPFVSAVAAENGTKTSLSKGVTKYQGRTSQTTSGTADFVNDCPAGQVMYVTIRKSYGPHEFQVDPKQVHSAPVARGDMYAANCSSVVPRRAAYDWIKLN